MDPMTDHDRYFFIIYLPYTDLLYWICMSYLYLLDNLIKPLSQDFRFFSPSNDYASPFYRASTTDSTPCSALKRHHFLIVIADDLMFESVRHTRDADS